MALAVVLLPQPDSPTTPTHSPGAMVKVTSRNTVVAVPPRCSVTLSSRTSSNPRPGSAGADGPGWPGRGLAFRSETDGTDRPTVTSRTESPSRLNATTVRATIPPVGTSSHPSWLLTLAAWATMFPQ